MAARSQLPLANRLADGQLKQTIEKYRAASVSWRAIADLLRNEHGIVVSGDTVRRWAEELEVLDAEPQAAVG